MPEPILDAAFVVEEWLADRMEKVPAVHDLAGGRVFPLVVPQSKDLPAVTYRRARTQRDRHMKGASGTTEVLFQVIVWTRSDKQGYLQGCRIAQGIRFAFDGFKGSDPGKGHYIERATLDDENDEDNLPVFADDVVGFQRVLPLTVVHLEQRRIISTGA